MSRILPRLMTQAWCATLLVIFCCVYAIDKHRFSDVNLATAHFMMAWVGTNITALVIYLDSRE